jgi:valyl-tRNA synthetase
MEKVYAFEKIEREIQSFWNENNVYRFDPDSTREIYSIDTPPPTVSGSLHIGHIFSYAQAEMIARYKRMRGYNVFYPFGFDDNGLPTERLVEREEGIAAKDMPRSSFNEKCMSATEKYVKEFKELWQSLGFSVDWSLQYETISPEAQRISQLSFIRLFRDGKAYMKESPVLWCTECRTSIAQAELDTAEKETRFNYIPFETVDGTERLIVATTRPELLFGCVCLFVHPDDERFAGYAGRNVTVPLYDYEIPVMTDEKVSMDKGTGIVMCATFGDSTDAEWFEKHKLPYRKVIMPDGTIDSNVPYIAGMRTKEAREEILRLLADKGLLIRSENITHTTAVHERCGKEIEIIPSRQWYIDILSNKEQYLEAAEKINWYPEYMKSRYINWVQNLKWDWCISRQRYFGVPFPVWYCSQCGKPIAASESRLPVNPLESQPDISCSCGCRDFTAETAVLDTWATSSVTPQINAGWGGKNDMSGRLLPMSMRTQAHEIIRTWAFYTIVKSLYHTGNIPWKDIMICGFVLAKKGEKISKSKNNSDNAPGALIEKHSADVIRYWAANSRLGTDTFFSPDELGIARRFVIKLWNASAFSISHLLDYDPEEETEMLPADRWITERCRQTVLEARDLLDQYEVGSARHVIDDFFWKDFCDYYLEIVKERLYRPDIHGHRERRSAQRALYRCLLELLKMYAVYVPHITEYIYQQYFRQHEDCISLHLTQWESVSGIEESFIEFGAILKEAVAETRRIKSERSLSMKAEIEEMTIRTGDKYREYFIRTIPDLKACCRANEIKLC